MARVDSFDVNVKDFRGNSVVIKVLPTWDVARVKLEISQHTKVAPHDFRLVFAGQSLADSLTLWDIGVQGYSTLHCIRGRGVEVTMSTPLDHVPLGTMTDPSPHPSSPQHNTVSMPANQTDGAAVAPQHRFYVYCKKPCGQMAPGKLRVRCANCKDTSFVLSGGPGGWEDVLTPRQLHGQCNREGCGGQDAEFYFKCANHRTEETEECVALDMVRANTIDVECASCLVASDLVVVFDCPDKHCMCVDCFKEYIKVKLTERQFEEHTSIGYTIKCPANCEGSEVRESHHFRMLGKDLYDRYQRFGTEEFVLKMGGVLCPQPECGMGLLPEDRGRRVVCPMGQSGGCGFNFCRICKEQYHEGPCRRGAPATAQPGADQFQVPPENLQRARWVQASEQFIETNTKPCPRCRVPIEKNGGCMHMTCLMAQCRYEWCWICCIPWNRQCQSTHWFG